MLKREKSAPPPGSDPQEYVMSDATVDRMGDVIEVASWQLDLIKTPPPVLFNHDRDVILGSWTDIRKTGKALVGKIKWAETDYPIVRYVRQLVEQGLLRTVSVAFRALASEPLTEKSSPIIGPFRFTKSELLECSLVSVPANPNAVAIARSLGLPRELSEMVFSKSANESHIHHGKPAKSNSEHPRLKMNMNIQGTLSQRIKAATEEFTARRERLQEISQDENPSAEDIQRAKELPAEIEEARQLMEELIAQERSLAVQPVMRDAPPRPAPKPPVTIEQPRLEPEVIPPARTRVFFSNTKRHEDGDYIWRSLAAMSTAVGSKETIDAVLREKFGNSDEKFQAVLRAVASPAMTSVAGWAQELNVTENQGFLDRLLPDSIYPRLASRGQRITFNNSNTIKVPTRTTSSTLAGAWVGEGNAKPVKKGSFSSITLNPYKLAVISTFTEEMAMYSVPQIQSIIQKAMQDDTSVTLDTFLIDNVALSAGLRPAGLLNGVSPITASAATSSADKIIADMTALSAAIIAAGGGTDIVYIMNPLQAQKLGLATAANGVFMFPDATAAAQKFMGSIIASATVPAGRVIAVDAAELITATGETPRFAVSTEATLHEEDTNPAALSATGTPNTVAAPMRSLFQTDAVAIRMVIYVTWQMRRTGMVQTIASVGW